MMHRMVQHYSQTHDRRKLQSTAEIHDLRQLLCANVFQLSESRLGICFVPGKHVPGRLERFRPWIRAQIEGSRSDGVHKPHLGGCNMPSQLQGAPGYLVRPVIALCSRNRPNNARSNALFVSDCGQIDSGQKKAGLFFFHAYRIAEWRAVKIFLRVSSSPSPDRHHSESAGRFQMSPLSTKGDERCSIFSWPM